MQYHELDTNGDIILNLRHQNLQSFPGTIEVADSQVIELTASGPGDLDSLRFRLSSKHLIRVSPVFKAMITGPWKESLAFAQCCCRSKARCWNTRRGRTSGDHDHRMECKGFSSTIGDSSWVA
ncbi:hypothetical protein E4U52_004827 [Claviceps spartinae]|nr:hypothetical protein E4U52_004827 [Claviceps spartinae]